MSRLMLCCAALLLSFQARAAPAAPSAEEVNAIGLLTGARSLDANGEPSDQGRGMIDGQLDQQHDPGLSDNKPLIIQLAESFDLSRLEVINSKDEQTYPGISVKN